MNRSHGTPRGPFALALAALLWLSSLAAPLAVVQACTSSGLGGAEEAAVQAIAQADVALIGTVTATEGVFQLMQEGGPLVRYTVDVERASVETGSQVHVHAVDDGGGASCGFTFDIGDRWMVAAFDEEGALQTGLCAGNTSLEGENGAMVDRLAARLPFVPAADSGEDALAAAVRSAPAVAAVVLLVGALMLTVLAFRRGGRSA